MRDTPEKQNNSSLLSDLVALLRSQAPAVLQDQEENNFPSDSTEWIKTYFKPINAFPSDADRNASVPEIQIEYLKNLREKTQKYERERKSSLLAALENALKNPQNDGGKNPYAALLKPNEADKRLRLLRGD